MRERNYKICKKLLNIHIVCSIINLIWFFLNSGQFGGSGYIIPGYQDLIVMMNFFLTLPFLLPSAILCIYLSRPSALWYQNDNRSGFFKKFIFLSIFWILNLAVSIYWEDHFFERYTRLF